MYPSKDVFGFKKLSRKHKSKEKANLSLCEKVHRNYLGVQTGFKLPVMFTKATTGVISRQGHE